MGVGDHGGDDGVVGSLSGSQDVRVAGLEVEVRAAVLEREAAALGDDAGAEAGVVAVDEGDAIAVCVGYGEVDGVGVVVGWAAVVEWGEGFVGVEELGSFGEVGF